MNIIDVQNIKIGWLIFLEGGGDAIANESV